MAKKGKKLGLHVVHRQAAHVKDDLEHLNCGEEKKNTTDERRKSNVGSDVQRDSSACLLVDKGLRSEKAELCSKRSEMQKRKRGHSNDEFWRRTFREEDKGRSDKACSESQSCGHTGSASISAAEGYPVETLQIGTCFKTGLEGEKKQKTGRNPGTMGNLQPSSLATRLKRLRGTAASTPAVKEWSGCGNSEDRSTVGRRMFVTPEDGKDYESCREECYRGFHVENPEKVPSRLHSFFSDSFDKLDNVGFFLYDLVQPGGKRLSRTFVSRTLVGNPGTTYRYLGLRLFSHPWCDVDEQGNACSVSVLPICDSSKKKKKNRTVIAPGSSLEDMGYSPKAASGLISMGIANRVLADRTKALLSRSDFLSTIPHELVGSAEYTITLINRMEPTSIKKNLRSENLHGIPGKTSVSWHMDSGLQDFSSIAVYHKLRRVEHEVVGEGVGVGGGVEHANRRNKNNKKIPWRVALRVTSGGQEQNQTPALSIPLPSGSLYYLLDDFNHNHEHAVLAGSNQVRYSSTHRVAREGKGTWQYIRNKCENTVKECTLLEECIGHDRSPAVKKNVDSVTKAVIAAQKRKLFAKEVRRQMLLLAEIEFEWLRQWQVQGKRHADIHYYWHGPMNKLKATFVLLEKRIALLLGCLKWMASSQSIASAEEEGRGYSNLRQLVNEEVFDLLIDALEDRWRQRSSWRERFEDPIFESVEESEGPMSMSCFDEKGGGRCGREKSRDLLNDPARAARLVRKWRSQFVERSRNEMEWSIGDRQVRSNKKGSSRNLEVLTKKERKNVASNWESMRGIIGKR